MIDRRQLLLSVAAACLIPNTLFAQQTYLDVALEAYTVTNAYAGFQDDRLGKFICSKIKI